MVDKITEQPTGSPARAYRTHAGRLIGPSSAGAAKRRDGSPPSLNAVCVRWFRRTLLHWYDRHRRDLPWRGSGDPYHVLVSEAMLQQTQVGTVIGYFSRFIEALATVAALAAAEEKQVLRLWQGLGYYRRARHLHAAAKMIIHDFDGRVPDSRQQLLELPGVGRYSAGAIASIAFGKAESAVDGNVARVLARFALIDEPIDDPAVRRLLWSLADQLVSRMRPGDFNQALMELGALVCTPASPNCPLCPLRTSCRAAATGRPGQLPIRVPRRAPVEVTHHVVAVHHNDRYLFEQRPDNGLWPSMWQLPTAEHDAAKKSNAWLADRLGLRIGRRRQIDTFTHQTTHRTITFVLWQAAVTADRLHRGVGTWRCLDAIDDLPLANPQRRAVKLLRSRS